MKLSREWYCLNCRKLVKEVLVSFLGGPPYCRECGSRNVMNLEQTNPEDLEKLVKKFREQTDKM